MQMIDVLKRLAELDANNPNVVNPMKPEVKEELVVETITEGKQGVDLPNMPEPDLTDLRALSGVKKLNESTIAECGMMPMGAPMPSLPASLNMSAGNAGEIVAMMRGIMDLAKGDVPTQTSMPTMGAPVPSMGDVDHDGDHDMRDHDLEQPDAGPLLGTDTEKKVSGPTFGDDGPANAEPVDAGDLAGDDQPGRDDGMGDELADIVKKIKTGQPVKITTDMPVKVTSDEPIKGRTDQQAKVDGDEDESYDNTPRPSTTGHTQDGNNFANIINKVRAADMADTPYGSGSNPMPAPDEKKEETVDPFTAFESKLMSDYKKFVEESEKKTMSRAAKGMMKYGKKGMKALSDAGKEGRDLEPVRAKYNKYDEGRDEFGKGKNFEKISKAAGGGEKGDRIAGAIRAKKIEKAGGHVKYAK